MNARWIKVRDGGNERLARVDREDEAYVFVRFYSTRNRRWDFGPISGYRIAKSRILAEVKGPMENES